MKSDLRNGWKREFFEVPFTCKVRCNGRWLAVIEGAVGSEVRAVRKIGGVDFEFEIVVETIGERGAEHLLGREGEAIGVGQSRLDAAGVIVACAEFEALEVARVEGVIGGEVVDSARRAQ